MFDVIILHSYYRPQMKFAKVMFLHVSVSHSVQRVDGGHGFPACIAGLRGSECIPACLAGLQAHTWGVSRPTPRGYPGPHLGGSKAHTWRGVSQHALRQTPPLNGYCCGWYTSYWNAFLFLILFLKQQM